jgi:hypothetical protein
MFVKKSKWEVTHKSDIQPVISGKLKLPAIHKLLCLAIFFKWTKSLWIFSVYVISCKDGGLYNADRIIDLSCS